MKPLFVLIAAFVMALLAFKLMVQSWHLALAGNIAMSVMLLFTAIGHFAYTKGMTMMVPDFFPFKKALVYFIGFIEIAAAMGLLISSLQLITAWLLLIFFMLMLPCNIYAAIKKIDYQKADYSGKGLSYLWFRVPFQLLLMAWVYACNIL